MHTAEYWIDHLKLLPHPEGGFYKETYRSASDIPSSALHARFGSDRSTSTAIYFLLRSRDKSLFHRIKSDEIWHFHAGSPLSIYVLHKSGLQIHKLGLNVLDGQAPQVVIPANCWFGATIDEMDSYTLAGCTVAPGFHFSDFELGKRDELVCEFPDQSALVKLLTA